MWYEHRQPLSLKAIYFKTEDSRLPFSGIRVEITKDGETIVYRHAAVYNLSSWKPCPSHERLDKLLANMI